MKKIIWLLPVIFMLTSCSLFSSVKAPEAAYVLKTIPQPPTARKSDLTIYVTPVDSDPLYNTAQIAYTNKPYQLSYFAKNVWAEQPSLMLQPMIVQTLQNTHFFRAVTTLPTGQSNIVLNTYLLELKQDFLDHNTVHLKVRATLLNTSTNEIIAIKLFNISQAACQRNPYGGVVAANIATSRFLYELAEFCLMSLRGY